VRGLVFRATKTELRANAEIDVVHRALPEVIAKIRTVGLVTETSHASGLPEVVDLLELRKRQKLTR
jgi:hypothetical protein